MQRDFRDYRNCCRFHKVDKVNERLPEKREFSHLWSSDRGDLISGQTVTKITTVVSSIYRLANFTTNITAPITITDQNATRLIPTPVAIPPN